MPFVLAPEVGAIAAALILFLFCVAVTYLLRAIASALGTLHIGPISLPFGKWFSAITSPVVTWLVGATNELWSDVTWWAHGISYIANGLVNDIVGGFSHAADVVDHIVTEVIPHAANQALADAKTAVGVSSAAIAHAISTATIDIEKVASADAARALAQAKATAHSIESDLTRLVAHDLTIGKKYTDTAIDDVKTWVGEQIGAIHIPDIGSLILQVGGIAGALAVAQTAIAAITSEFEECAVTTCEGPNNLSGLLNTLLGLAGLADFAAFLSDAIDNPAGVESEYAATFQGIIQPLVTGGGDIFSAIESVLGL